MVGKAEPEGIARLKDDLVRRDLAISRQANEKEEKIEFQLDQLVSRVHDLGTNRLNDVEARLSAGVEDIAGLVERVNQLEKRATSTSSSALGETVRIALLTFAPEKCSGGVVSTLQRRKSLVLVATSQFTGANEGCDKMWEHLCGTLVPPTPCVQNISHRALCPGIHRPFVVMPHAHRPPRTSRHGAETTRHRRRDASTIFRGDHRRRRRAYRAKSRVEFRS